MTVGGEGQSNLMESTYSYCKRENHHGPFSDHISVCNYSNDFPVKVLEDGMPVHVMLTSHDSYRSLITDGDMDCMLGHIF